MTPSLDQPGYPQRHHDEVSRARRYGRNALLITGVPFVLLLIGTLADFVPPVLTALAAALFFMFGLVGAGSGLYDALFHARVHPYFKRPIEDIDTFLAGRALLRYLTQLDVAATQLGVRPLSTFGFNDDLRGEKLQWHSASEGLATVDALSQWLETAEASADVRNALRADLTKWRHAFKRAEAQGVPFCLLLRHCNATSAQEWEVREGSAF